MSRTSRTRGQGVLTTAIVVALASLAVVWRGSLSEILTGDAPKSTAYAAEPDADERPNDDDDVPEPCKDADDGDPDVGPRDPDIDGRPNIGRRDPDPDEPGECPKEPVDPEPEPIDPNTAVIEFFINTTKGRPGEKVALTLSLKTEVELEGLTLAINFDEQALVFEESEPARTEDGQEVPHAVAVDESNDNTDDLDGDQNTEGWVYIKIQPPASVVPASDVALGAVPLLTLYFTIRDDVVDGYFAKVGFEEIGPVLVSGGTREFVRNTATIKDSGRDHPREVNDTEDGGVEVEEGVIGEVGFFLRGDANMDCQRDISDAVVILNYLYTGGAELSCADAADSDDNAIVELSDPVFVLSYLFRKGTDFPEPMSELQEDPTKDYRIFCEGGFEDEYGCGSDSPERAD